MMLLLPILLAVLVAPPLARQGTEAGDLQAAFDLKKAGQTEAAALAFAKFAVDFPEAERALEAQVECGVCWFMHGRDARALLQVTPKARASFDRSLEVLRRITKEHPDASLAARATYMQGSVHHFAGELALASEAFSTVLERYKGDAKYSPQALERRAHMRFGLLDHAGALADLERFQKDFGPKAEAVSLVTKALPRVKQAGQPASEWTSKTWLHQGPVSLSDYAGTPIALYFFAHWCPDCNKELPHVLDVKKRFAARGLMFVGVITTTNGASHAVVQAYLAKNQIDFPVLLDDGRELSKLYDVPNIPELVLIDAEGRMRWHETPSVLYDATLERLLVLGR